MNPGHCTTIPRAAAAHAAYLAHPSLETSRAACDTCDGCPQRIPCLDLAMRTEHGFPRSGRAGIYGGMNPSDRARRDHRTTDA